MNFGKRVSHLLLSLLIIASFAFPVASSAEPLDTMILPSANCQPESNMQTTQAVDIGTSDVIVTPLVTCTGSGGVSRINWMETARQIEWDVNPYADIPFNFSGEIEVVDTQGGTTYIPVSCSNGPLATTPGCGDIESFSGVKDHVYTATLHGIATDWFTGLELEHVIAAGCKVAFKYR